MLDVIDLNYDYPDKPVLQKVRFTLSAGNLLHLRGANGAGKTTLLKLLAGLLHPDGGQIHYDGFPIEHDLAAYQQNLCYIGHKIGISLLLTVRENCFLGLSAVREAKHFDKIMKQLALNGLEDTPCHLLSMGQRRRVGLTRLLVSDASLWLLDEPLVGLDKEGVYLLMNCLDEHLAQGGQIILTSHQRFVMSEQQRYQEYGL
ncbi:cytochrome c biogenesis heme-transporting ATPase CcmA [Legionella oakridgensis]|uniref:Heme ABC exporter, ATP-binding protein CcmA n=2 Tax=Legionella oakridgensis TaxID=29423 RepID=W0BEH3_9GAMM|nr:cytochrome c biogenesis heme-transporting ATPase CcmA [Legionella oakridgensis]AHE66799.1 heme ABC exporter, ATP-binding protein CcmA [Legionella oakridgensis ATCC 33761 = DSM 21215]KTD39803.1 heme exporter protein CcmA [Legionella oakridgensis]STY19917.1 heme exporter protein CcmA [Legionella longbeachae]